MTDDDLPFDRCLPEEQPSITGWRSEPPTLVEFLRWPYWWIRMPCCAPMFFSFDDDPGDLSGALWAPAIPPERT